MSSISSTQFVAKALIIIDMNARDVKKLYNCAESIKNQLKLIDAFLKRKQKVILVGGSRSGKVSARSRRNPVMVRLWGREGEHDSAGNKIIPELMRAHHDKYICKSEYSAFFRTDLERYCKKNKIDQLYFCGIYAGCCVYFSAADAAMRQIQPYLVTDASSSVSPAWHRKHIKNFTTFIGPAITTKELLKKA